MQHIEEETNHIEENEEYIEEPITKPKKKMTFTAEQLERKKLSIMKAREHKKIYKEENKVLKEKLEEVEKKTRTKPTPTPEEEEPEEEEPKPKTKKILPPKQTLKPIPKQKIIYKEDEDEDDDDEEEYEEVIVRRRPKKNIQKIPQYIERPDLIDETYREKLQKQLMDERRKQVMADLFDF